MTPSKPLVSIITVTYNAAGSIDATIKSIVDQNSSKNEFIVIDGRSNDGTVKIIEKYQEYINYWISEPDGGIYDAMNKAIKIAKGKYLYFINAGDLLINIPYDILNEYADLDVKLLAFPVMDSDQKLRLPRINAAIKIKNTLPHQGCFYKNDFNMRYDLRFKVFSDFDLNQRLYLQRHAIKTFENPVVALHDLNGVSHNKEHGKEIFEVVNSNFGLVYKSLSFIYFKGHGLLARLKKIFN